jgi:hypothetical protein
MLREWRWKIFGKGSKDWERPRRRNVKESGRILITETQTGLGLGSGLAGESERESLHSKTMSRTGAGDE